MDNSLNERGVKLDVLDLIIETLKDQEKMLDDLCHRLQVTLDTRGPIQLRDRGLYRLPNGGNISITSLEEPDNHDLVTVHFPGPGRMVCIDPRPETGGNISIYFPDNLAIEKVGTQKDNPIFNIYDDEFKCRLIIHHEEKNITVEEKW